MKNHKAIPIEVTDEYVTFACLCGYRKRFYRDGTRPPELLAAGDQNATHSGSVTPGLDIAIDVEVRK